MNRRQLFSWLSALPFVPAALAKTAFASGMRIDWKPVHTNTGAPGWALRPAAVEPITFPVPTVEWGKIVYFYDGTDGYVLESGKWKRISDEPDFIDMKFRPKLPEWF